MSYSRWGESYWYTFWCIPVEGVPESYYNAIFEICGVTRFRAADIRKDLDGCVKTAVSMVGHKKGETKPTTEDIEDLADCMARFLKDVDIEYKVKN